jgi:Phosphotransferase enzyme family
MAADNIMPKLKLVGGICSIATHVAWERVRRSGPPTDISEVPASASQLTREWLTAALCSDIPGARVTDLSLGGGSDGSSARRSVTVAYNNIGDEAGLPTAIFTKSTPRFANRFVLGLTGAAGNECLFYNECRPTLNINSPIGYYAAFDAASKRSMIVTEDVGKTRNATFGDALQTLTRAEAEDMVTQLAVLHGTFWESAWLRDTPSLRSARNFQTHFDDTIAFRRQSLVGLDRAQAVVPQSVQTQKARLWASFHKSLSMHDRRPQTLLHQDPHPGNWYRDGSGRMGLYDWQGTTRGWWALDYCYAVQSALGVDDRRAWERELLALYTEHLARAGGVMLTADQAWDEYRLHSLHGLAFWLYTIGAPRLAPAMQPDKYSMAIIGRITQAMEDHDTMAAIDLADN